MEATRGKRPISQVTDVCGMGQQSWLCDFGLVHMHYSAGTQVWNITSQREVYDLFSKNVREHPVFNRAAVVMKDYSHDGVVAIDPASSSYPRID
ncbi:hypothetical protein F5Y14DRAFT_452353 [Nemania sp. NC0429]|nr:hypothetical protein F5Y14DRAFT_452353 [Nemania sp. NC0429]